MDVQKPDAKYLVLAEKWIEGTITPDEEKAFAAWYNQGQDEPLYVPGAIAPDDESLRQRMLAYILKWKDEETPVRKVSRRKSLYLVAAACLSALALGTVWYYFHAAAGRPPADYHTALAHTRHFIEKINTSDSLMLVVLPDSSTVQVEKNSRIFYSGAYGRNNRDVHLEGGAVFEVRHNPELPFEVYASGLVTKVLGTRFHVSAYTGRRQVVVSVSRGKVSVSEEMRSGASGGNKQADRAAGYVLNPNQQVVFDPASGQMQKSLVALPETLRKRDAENLHFAATPLNNVFYRLGKIYGISIVFDEVSLKHCTLTADLSAGSFYDKLEKICIAANLHYSEMDGHILISGKGCN